MNKNVDKKKCTRICSLFDFSDGWVSKVNFSCNSSYVPGLYLEHLKLPGHKRVDVMRFADRESAKLFLDKQRHLTGFEFARSYQNKNQS